MAEEEIMADSNTAVDLARIEGKIDLITQSQRRTDDDLKQVRERVHSVANALQPLIQVPANIAEIKSLISDHTCRIDVLERDKDKRDSALSTLKVVWAVAGAAVTLAVTVAFKILSGG